VDVADLVEAILLMSQDTSDGHRIYFISHPEPTDTKIMWETLGHIFSKKVLIIPMPKPLLYVAMLVSTLGAKIFGYTNQLDQKQYLQITASAFVCSSKSLQDHLGWVPALRLEESMRIAAKAYEEAGLL